MIHQIPIRIHPHHRFNSILTWLFVFLLPLFVSAQHTVQSESQVKTDPIGDTYLRVDGIRMHFLIRGQGKPVVLIHGNPGFLQDYSLTVFDRLATTFKTIAYDRPGHGLSNRGNRYFSSLKGQAKLLHDAMLQLGVEKPILVGHSWGGSLALCYALQYPKEISGMVLLAPSAFPDSHGNLLESAIAHTPVLGTVLIRALKPLVIHEINAGLRSSFFPRPVPEYYKNLADKIWSSPNRLKSYIFDSLALRKALNQISNRYGEIRTPVTIISGVQDQVVGYKTDAVPLHDAINGSRLITLSATGHAIQYENPRVVVDAVIAMHELTLCHHFSTHEQGEMLDSTSRTTSAFSN